MNVERWNNLTDQVTLYVPFVLLVFGNVSCLLNLFTFTTKELRRNSCGWYFLMSSLTDLFFINFGLISKLSSDHFGSNYQNSSRTYCKIRIYLTWTVPCLSTSYLFLSSLDRCLSTSNKVCLRSLSQIRIAHRLKIIPFLLYGLTNLHQLFYFDLQPKCVAQSGSYSIFLSIYSILWTSLLPQSLLIIFSLLTSRNVRRSRERLHHGTGLNHGKSRRDIHLIKMMLVQVIASSILLNIRTIYYSYYVISTDLIKSENQKALENFLYQLSNYFFYLNFCKSFYLNTLMSQFFRQVFFKRLQSSFHRISPTRFRRIAPIHLNHTMNN